MSKLKPTLGPVTHNARGFEIVQFADRYGLACSLQQSSLAEMEKPGTSAVWLGVSEHDRMHLDRKQVAALIAHLKNWLTRDTFKLP
ncbi:MAG TPA: hypothetical protein VF077_12960 [Nitrospiraceae bacterium]